MAAGSFGGTRRPLTSGSTISGSEAASEAITGHPRAIASTSARPNSSWTPAEPSAPTGVGWTSAMARPSRSTTSASGSAPWKWTSLPAASARRRSR